MEIGALDFSKFSLMRSTDSLKWQRMLSAYQFFIQKKGKQQTVKDVEFFLKSTGIEVCTRDVQRDLMELKNNGVLENIGKGKNLRYKIPAMHAIDFYSDLYENDIFSFLLVSRILFWMFGENISIESLEKAISDSSRKQIGLHGKDLYEHLSVKMSGLLEYVGEQSAKRGKPKFLPTVIKGLLEQRKLEVEYIGSVDEFPKKITLEPWALIVYKSALYILCPDKSVKSEWKTFKLSRFQSVKILSETFEKKSDILKKELDRMKYSGTIWDAKNILEEKPVLIKLKFGWYDRLILQENLFLNNMKIIEHKNADKNKAWIEVHMKSPINKDLLTWIRSWGYGAKVIAPQELKDEIVNYGKWLIQQA